MARPQLCISGDSHVVETGEIFNGLPERFGDAAPRMVYVEGTGDILQIGDTRRFPVGRFGVAGHYANDPETQEMIKMGYKGLRPGILDPMERIKDQDIDGLDAEVLLPSIMFGVYGISDPEIVAATFKNFNDWILNYANGAPPKRLFASACIPLHDIDKAIEELRRVKNMGHVAANIPCVPPADRPYSDRSYDKFWAVAEELELPLVMHVLTTAQPNMGLPTHWGPVMGYALWQTAMAYTMGDINVGGVCARFPNLKFVPTEWETGWVAHYLQRLDWAAYRVPRDQIPAELTESPSFYFHRQFTMTFEDDRQGLATRYDIGVKNLMWGSDFPHHDSTFPKSQAILDDIFDDIPDEERFAMTVSNCVDLYGLPIEY
jgi:predicted TIM-barrel fold metal-dependent hydrolase